MLTPRRDDFEGVPCRRLPGKKLKKCREVVREQRDKESTGGSGAELPTGDRGERYEKSKKGKEKVGVDMGTGGSKEAGSIALSMEEYDPRFRLVIKPKVDSRMSVGQTAGLARVLGEAVTLPRDAEEWGRLGVDNIMDGVLRHLLQGVSGLVTAAPLVRADYEKKIQALEEEKAALQKVVDEGIVCRSRLEETVRGLTADVAAAEAKYNSDMKKAKSVLDKHKTRADDLQKKYDGLHHDLENGSGAFLDALDVWFQSEVGRGFDATCFEKGSRKCLQRVQQLLLNADLSAIKVGESSESEDELLSNSDDAGSSEADDELAGPSEYQSSSNDDEESD